MKILIFSPHPDDDLIGCGGSIIKHIKNGCDVTVVYMTSGEAGCLNYSKEKLSEIRESETRLAADSIGIKNVIFFKNPDGYLEYDKINLVRVISLIRAEKPDLVYIPHENDGHKDHVKTNEIVIEAIGRASGPWFQECGGQPWAVRNVLCYEVWTPLQEIGYVEDITDFIDEKINALKLHVSQIRDINYGEAVKGLNRYRGIMTGRGKYCECFQVLRTDSI